MTRSLVLAIALVVLSAPALAAPTSQPAKPAVKAVVVTKAAVKAPAAPAKAVVAPVAVKAPVKAPQAAPAPKTAPKAPAKAVAAPKAVPPAPATSQPASAPVAAVQAPAASQPAPSKFKAWVKANQDWLLILAVLLPSLITALAKYPKAKGLVAALQILLDLFSVLTHRDSPGTLKVPLLTRSQPPKE